MIPVLYRFTFETPLARALFYVLALALVAYSAFNGWRSAVGPVDPKTGAPRAPSQKERQQRAMNHALFGVALAFGGMYYALPEVPLYGRGLGNGIPIHTYGVLVGAGFMSAVSVAGWLAQREWPGDEGRRRREQIYDMAFYLFGAGIGGSMLLYNIVNWNDVMKSGLQTGMVFQGGFICAAVTALWYANSRGMNFLRLADLCAPTVSLGAAFGRLGCFAAGCCWGKTAKPGMPFAVHFPGAQTVKNLFGGHADTPSLVWSGMRESTRWFVESTGEVLDTPVDGATRVADWVSQHQHTLPIHPTQLYDSLAQLTFFVLTMSLRRYRRFHGQIFGIWLMGYAVIRSSAEVFRGDSVRGTLHGWVGAIPLDAWYNISTGQLISALMFAFGAYVVVRQYRQFRAQAPAAVGVAQPA